MFASGALLVGALVAGAQPAAAADGCTLVRLAELPVTMTGRQPIVSATINGAPAAFLADSGAFYSMMSAASAAEFKLKPYPAPWGLHVTGIGGQASGLAAARVKDFTLGGVPIVLHDIEFLVGGGGYGAGVGVLGQNVFSIADVEYDLANGVIRLIRENGCAKSNFAYWTNATEQSFSMMSIEHTSPRSPHTTGTALLNGVSIRVMFDTGAWASILSQHAAARAGIKVDGPGVVEAGYAGGVGRGSVKTWVGPVASFKIGQEEIRNTKLRFGDLQGVDTDMLIGADFFLSHRVYVSSKQHQLFFTYNGGPVFNLSVSAQAAAPPPSSVDAPAAPAAPAATAADTGAPPNATAAPGAAGAARPEGDSGTTAASGAPGASGAPPPVPAGEPQNAEQFARRGAAYVARHDFERAIADLDRACALAPDQAQYFYERGVAFRQHGDLDHAMADFDKAVDIQPADVTIRMARADLEFAQGNVHRAADDLDAVDRLAAKEADVRYVMGIDYLNADLFLEARAQLDLWIAAHPDEGRLANAYLLRCRVGALSGRDLPQALKDCDDAFRRADKSNPAFANVLTTRGVIRLRLGDYDKSIADFDAALKVQPKEAWALYGRGIAKARRGRSADAEADMAAARALSPHVAAQFSKRGLTP